MSKKITDLTSATTPLGGTEVVEIVQGGTSKKVAVSYLAGSAGGREILTADRTYYVRTDGSDSNNGLANTSGGAFLTIQKAVDTVCGLDLSTRQVTIQVGDGTYTAGADLGKYVGSKPPLILGNATTPANVIISASNLCMSNTSGFNWRIESMTLYATTAHAVLARNPGSALTLVSVNFGTMGAGYSHMVSEFGAYIDSEGAYTISGGAAAHIMVQYSSSFKSWNTSTVTISGTPSFSVAFAICKNGASMRNSGKTFSGSATGVRYDVNMNGIIFTNGGGATYFPGNSSGTTATGGQYA